MPSGCFTYRFCPICRIVQLSPLCCCLVWCSMLLCSPSTSRLWRFVSVLCNLVKTEHKQQLKILNPSSAPDKYAHGITWYRKVFQILLKCLETCRRGACAPRCKQANLREVLSRLNSPTTAFEYLWHFDRLCRHMSFSTLFPTCYMSYWVRI